MPSPTSRPRRSRARSLITPAPPAGRQAVHDPAAKPVDVREDARQAHTREYMLAENEREALLVKKGYWF